MVTALMWESVAFVLGCLADRLIMTGRTFWDYRLEAVCIQRGTEVYNLKDLK